jgi:hypothetical protein
MPQAKTISLSKFTGAVQEAVKAAAQRHPKFKIDQPKGVSISYLIRGIPVPESILAGATLGETQAFANDVAESIASAHPEAVSAVHGATPRGAIVSIGGHVILGIPAFIENVVFEK